MATTFKQRVISGTAAFGMITAVSGTNVAFAADAPPPNATPIPPASTPAADGKSCPAPAAAAPANAPTIPTTADMRRIADEEIAKAKQALCSCCQHPAPVTHHVAVHHAPPPPRPPAPMTVAAPAPVPAPPPPAPMTIGGTPYISPEAIYVPYPSYGGSSASAVAAASSSSVIIIAPQVPVASQPVGVAISGPQISGPDITVIAGNNVANGVASGVASNNSFELNLGNFSQTINTDISPSTRISTIVAPTTTVIPTTTTGPVRAGIGSITTIVGLRHNR